MKQILLTGATGFIGRAVAPMMRQSYTLLMPSRQELDLRNVRDVQKYIGKHHFDAVIHLANPTGHNPQDTPNELFEHSMRVFMSLEHCLDLYGKLIYIGSGAEYAKHRAIKEIAEEEFGAVLPEDAYGLARYTMSLLAKTHKNVVNLRLFACFGQGDPPHKLLPYVMNCIADGRNIQLRQDARFDYLYTEDIYPVLSHFIDNTASHSAYNLCSGERVLISEIAREVCKRMGSNADILFEQDGQGLEYTASNKRLRAEIPTWAPRSMSEAVETIINKEGYRT